MSRHTEEAMEISSTTDLGDPKSTTKEQNEDEPMEVERVEAEESQTAEITSTSPSLKRIEEKIEATSEGASKSDTNEAEENAEKKTIEENSNETNEDIDMVSPGKDETDATEKTSDEKDSKSNEKIGEKEKLEGSVEESSSSSEEKYKKSEKETEEKNKKSEEKPGEKNVKSEEQTEEENKNSEENPEKENENSEENPEEMSKKSEEKNKESKEKPVEKNIKSENKTEEENINSEETPEEMNEKFEEKNKNSKEKPVKKNIKSEEKTEEENKNSEETPEEMNKESKEETEETIKKSKVKPEEKNKKSEEKNEEKNKNSEEKPEEKNKQSEEKTEEKNIDSEEKTEKKNKKSEKKTEEKSADSSSEATSSDDKSVEISSSDKTDDSTEVTSSGKTDDKIAEDTPEISKEATSTETGDNTEDISKDTTKIHNQNPSSDISKSKEETANTESSVNREQSSDEAMEIDNHAIETVETDNHAKETVETDNHAKETDKHATETVETDKSEKTVENDESQKNDINTDKGASASMEIDSSPTKSATSRDKDNNDLVINDGNSIFVQDNPISIVEKEDPDKPLTPPAQATTDVDPIGSTEWSQNIESETTFASELEEADECIIPDASRDEVSSTPSKELSSQTSTPCLSSQSSESSKLSDTYLVSVANTDDHMTCMICDKKTLCRYDCSKDEVKTKICSEDCLGKLKAENPKNVIVRQLRVKSFSIDRSFFQSSILGESGNNVGMTTSPRTITCINCNTPISNANKSLSWEALDFCNEQCLTKHQKLIGSFCANCKIDVKDNFLGKYCVRFGYNVRQFCSSTCLEEYKKSSKVCSFCQDDISGNTGEFSTSIGDKGLTKDFCSGNCMQRYSTINKQAKGHKIIGECCVCHKTNLVDIEFEYRSKNNFFCSEPCFVAFKYVHDIKPEKCDMCCQHFIPISNNQPYLMRYDGIIRKFCLKTCQNIYITTRRKIVSCCWCKVKKYNFDMIQKYQPNSSVLIICSLICLNFFNASINASKMKKKRCDFCNKICKGQYHITLADDTMKNFCSYPCVQEYQSKYLLAPARYTEQPVAISSQAPASTPTPPSTPTPTRVSTRRSAAQQRKQIIPDLPGPLPIITSVRSLAPTTTSNTRQLRSKSSAPNIATLATIQEPPAPPPIRRIVLLRPPDLPSQRNMSTLAKPINCDVEVECKPVMVDKAVQTEDIKDGLVLVALPIPIFVPSPVPMFEMVRPMPLPFPLSIPIPMFIPVTKQTASIVLKEMKKNQIRTDPYEADLLMMAELVAGEVEKKEEPPENESDGETAADNPPDTFTPEPQDPSTSFGEDMLQMALKMATDFEEPAVDLEGALTASTITATASSNQREEVTPVQPPVERTTFRGRKRGRPPRHGGRGRGRGRPPTQREPVIQADPEPPQPSEPTEKADANMCLKYTFGVNAWKQWVTTKNAELERASRTSKPFKTDLLQLTGDELNYSLCLFVKEVRKPNGAEYAPDTIYYLCLGIQQFLYENGRIENIFCDSYYESFTECLDEVCKKFSTLYNDSQYIVTRVEEEHLWESKQLGAHSPFVLLTTLMFFNTKHFNLTNVEEHMQLSFSHIMKHWKRVPTQVTKGASASGSRNILLRFYPPQSALEGNNRKKKVYEQQEDEENPLRCPVKLYEFYLSKCPESVKTRNDVFYLSPERSCVPDSPVWYSTMALAKEPLEKMLHRVKMVKEINVALLAS